MTQQEIKKIIIKYLDNTSKHIFKYEDGTIFRVIKKDDRYHVLDYRRRITSEEINVDNIVSYWMENSKCIIKHRLFMGKKLTSIKKKSVKYENIEK